VKNIKLALVLPIFFSAFYAHSAELVLSGAYQGKDIYVQNPFDPSTKMFCTQEVYVNDRRVFDQPKISAYKIDLSYLRVGDLVVIRILHSDGCTPRVVNPQVLKNTSEFKFLTAETDNNSLNWSTQGEVGVGSFLIEQKTEEIDWAVIDTVTAKGSAETNLYTVRAPHQKGVNKYRIRYENTEGLATYSMDMAYTDSKMITFFPAITTSSLTLSDSAEYVITDYFGKEILKGEGIKISVADLKPGEYYLNIQNRKEKFVKK